MQRGHLIVGSYNRVNPFVDEVIERIDVLPHARTQILTGSERGHLLNQTSTLEKRREQAPLFLGLTAQSVLISRSGTKQLGRA